jgi:hypothetical protein
MVSASKRRWLLAIWEQRGSAPKLLPIMLAVRQVLEESAPEWAPHFRVIRAATEAAPRSTHKTTPASVLRDLTMAGMIERDGRYLRTREPKRYYQEMPGGWWVRDMRRYRLADWPEAEHTGSMAQRLTTEQVTLPRRARAVQWSKYADGQPWLLRQGEDFDQDPAAAGRAWRLWCRRQGQHGQAAVGEDGKTLTVQLRNPFAVGAR